MFAHENDRITDESINTIDIQREKCASGMSDHPIGNANIENLIESYIQIA